MEERQILFTGEMVQAILDGRKTQTRRVVKPQPPAGHWWAETRAEIELAVQYYPSENGSGCPYGQPGDRLWVRETWAVGKRLDTIPPRDLEFLTSNPDFPQSTIYYRADSYNGVNPLRGKWRASIHMPRWASRITLDVTGVRVERVQDIDIQDAIDEGISLDGLHDYPAWDFSDGVLGRFAYLWDSINAKRGFGWDVNPWVWIVEFKQAV